MITNQNQREMGIFISLEDFINKKPISDVSLKSLEKDFGIPSEDAHETLYVIYTQGKSFSLLNEILDTEYPTISKGNYFQVARRLFKQDALKEYAKENNIEMYVDCGWETT